MKIYNLEDTDEADGSIQAESMDSVSLPQFLVSQEKKKKHVSLISLSIVYIFAFLSQGAAKTPVSLLQELYVKKGINPKYDLIQIEGAIHEPTFKYRVSVGELVGMLRKLYIMTSDPCTIINFV